MKNRFPIHQVLNFLKAHQVFILLESILSTRENHLSYLFINPVNILKCSRLEEVKPCLEALQKAKENGYYVSGFLSYEAGYAFSKATPLARPSVFPLIWMGIFKKPIIFDHKRNIFHPNPFFKKPMKQQEQYSLKHPRLTLSQAQYKKDIAKIKRLIEKGDTYQVNHTFKYKFSFVGCPFSLYNDLRLAQPVSYGAFIRTPEFNILSFSPELFFRYHLQNIYTQPMKGTAPRGINAKDDALNKKLLRNDAKNRAENLMIVDLLRNDLGKISETGSVKTQKLFSIEQYRTLFQMTSLIKSRLKKDVTLFELFSSLFPSGSVTGAPKIRTMQIIQELEKEQRKIYTGSIGFISPENTGVFNVAIRTILLENNRAEMGIGSGITYSSDEESEYAECTLKSKFLTSHQFQLIETIRFSQKEGFYLLGLHLKRLKSSADFFGFDCNLKFVMRCLKQATNNASAAVIYKLRLLLSSSGKIYTELTQIPKTKKNSSNRIAVSGIKIDQNNLFLNHKTTNRALYDKEYARYRKLGYYEVIFRNKKNQITEGAISNIFIKKGRFLYSPPVSCGILPGVFRQHLLEKYNNKIKEKILFLEDLKTAQEIYIANSVRGMVKVRF